MKLLTRRGVLIEEEEEGSSYLADADADSDDARALRPLQAAACTYGIAFGPRAGQKVFTVQGATPRGAALTQEPCADHQGFSLHAAVPDLAAATKSAMCYSPPAQTKRRRRGDFVPPLPSISLRSGPAADC